MSDGISHGRARPRGVGDTDRFPLRPGGFGRDWWTGRSVDVAQIARDLDAAGVDRAVIVQAVGPYGNDNRYARAVVAGDPDRFALVAAIDTDRRRSRRRARGAGRRRRRGRCSRVRRGPATRPGSPTAGARRSGTPPPAPGSASSSRSSPTTCDAVGALVRAARRRRRPRPLRVPRSRRWPALSRSAGPLFALAALPAVHLKVTTIVLLAARRCRRIPAARRPARRRVRRRTGSAWGSDHPQTFEIPYPEMVELAIDAYGGLAPADRAAVLGGTAGRLWFGDR